MRTFRVSVSGNDYEVEVEEIKSGAAPAPRTSAPAVPVAPTPAQVKKDAPVAATAPARGGTGTVKAPMPGTILSISVENGDPVTRGQVLCMLEAMKMENEVRAVADGVIASVEIKTGDQISAGQTMFVLA